MGIVVNYSSTLNDVAELDQMLADVREFCRAADWPFEEVAEPISGVALMTPEDFMDRPGKKREKKATIH